MSIKISLFFICLFLKISSIEYPNSKLCAEKVPKSKEDCHVIESELYSDNNDEKRISCCYVTYKLDGEKFQKCVPILNTLNSIDRYKEQLSKMSKVDINCNALSAKYNILATLLLLLIYL